MEDKILRQGGTHWLKIPVEALLEILDAEGRQRWDEMTARLAAAKGTIAITATAKEEP